MPTQPWIAWWGQSLGAHSRIAQDVVQAEVLKALLPQWEFVGSQELGVSAFGVNDDKCIAGGKKNTQKKPSNKKQNQNKKNHRLFPSVVFFLGCCASAHFPTPLLRAACGSSAVLAAYLM